MLRFKFPRKYVISLTRGHGWGQFPNSVDGLVDDPDIRQSGRSEFIWLKEGRR